MKDSLLIIFASFFILYSCNKKNENNTTSISNTKKDSVLIINKNENITGINPDFEFNMKVNQKDIKPENTYFEIEDNLLIINALSDNNKLFIVSDSLAPGNYSLDNRSFYVSDEQTYYVDSGNLQILSYEQEMLNGNFDLNAINMNDSNDIQNIVGNFKKISTIRNLSEGTKLNVTQVMKVNQAAGKVDYNDCNIEVVINENQIAFNDIDNPKNSFSFAVNNKIKEGTTCIFSSSNTAIDKIYIDLLKKQITLFYKNKNTSTYF